MADNLPVSTELSNQICLSIIVPVYNISMYLGSCLDSLVVVENIENAEIIIVDDGSTDGSGRIADSYATKYSFVSCFHKKNGGLSDARNYGLRIAKGRFVFFCDSDDMIIPEAFCKIIDTAMHCEADVLMWDGITIGKNNNDIDFDYGIILNHAGLDNKHVMTGLDAMIDQINDHGKYAMTAWLMACNREFLLNNDLIFETDLIHEDELWTPQVLLHASAVYYLQETVYCYRIRPESIIGSSSKNQELHAKALVYIMNSLYKLYNDQIEDISIRNVILAEWADKYMWGFADFDIYRYEFKNQVNRFDILHSSKGFKNKIKCMILCLFGFRTYCALIRRLRRVRTTNDS